MNGAHDIFMNVLADQGFVGLALFLAILCVIALRCVGAWRRFRATERAENIDAAAKERARSLRVTLGVVSASITAYLVQAMFNVQQVGLSFTFWLLVGLLAVLSRAAGVPATLRPAVLLSPETNNLRLGHERENPLPAGEAEPRRPGRSPLFVPWQTGLAALVVIVVFLVTSLGTDGPYRADHDYWAASASLTTAPASGASGQPRTEVGTKFFTDIQHAEVLNPLEPTYPAFEASIYQQLASSASTAAGGQTILTDLDRARQLYAEAVAREPLDSPNLVGEANIDGYLSELQPAEAHSDLTAAAALSRRAISEDPLNTDYLAVLKQVLAAEHPKVGKKPVPKKS